MNTNSVLVELHQMPANIKVDAFAWQQNILKGGTQMKLYTELCAKIFDNENLLENSNSSRQLRHAKKRIRRLFKRLDKIYDHVAQTLAKLGDIRLRTEQMCRRVRLWAEDECLRQHCISWELTTHKLLEFLQFLTLRYDCEWEVKEMVMLELEKVSNNYDAHILLEAWLDNSHAGGEEFNRQLVTFYSSIGQRHTNAQYPLKYA